LRDLELWADGRKANDETFPKKFRDIDAMVDERAEPSMLSLDDPAHKRLRGLVKKAFTPKAVEKMRARAREIAQTLLDGIVADEFDFMAEFASPYPTTVIAEMLGVNPDDRDRFKAWSNVSVEVGFNVMASEAERENAAQVNRQLNDLFRQEVAERRRAPRDDLIGAMVQAQEAGERLSDEEIVAQCNLLLVAGNVTTTDLIGNGLKALLEHPEQLQALRENPTLINNAVEEMLRFDGPVDASARIASKDLEVSGCPIHKGEYMYVSLAAANHDPEIYPNPDGFDLHRKDVHHQAFGGGSHHCLGAPLARLEAQEAVLAVLERFSEIAISERGFQYRMIPNFRGLSEFWIQVAR
jgi:hypothetical protein